MFDLVLNDDLGQESILHYDPTSSSCVWKHSGDPIDLTAHTNAIAKTHFESVFPVSPQNPAKKTRSAQTLKIQLGLKCNFSCTYCNQRSQPHDGDANSNLVGRFLEKLPAWFDFDADSQVRIEFWGGEPLVYWKMLKPLAEGIRNLYPNASFSMITNGSLLDKEKVDWLRDLKFSVAISHDGPSHEATRGPDPLKDPNSRKWIRYAHERLSTENRIGFNCVLSSKNFTLFPVRKYIADQLGIPIKDIHLSSEEILLPYDAGGLSLSVLDGSLSRRLTHTVFFEAITGRTSGISSVEAKLSDFLQSLAQNRPAVALGQKCGMDKEDTLAVDLNGNVLTCQNTASQGKHRIGHLDQFDQIKLNTAYHWSTRAECVKCPLVQLCQGACLFLEDDLWQQACDNSFSYNLGILAAAIFRATGSVLTEIRGANIRGRGFDCVQVIEPDFLKGPLPDWYFEGMS